jgi:hypothetical protein
VTLLQPSTLCLACRWHRTIVSGKGSQFLLCELSLRDERFAKYPRQPMLRCPGFERPDEPCRDNSARPEESRASDEA